MSDSLRLYGPQPSRLLWRGAGIHGILQARLPEWVARLSSRGSSQSTVESTSLMSPALAGGFFTTESPGKQVTQIKGSVLQDCLLLRSQSAVNLLYFWLIGYKSGVPLLQFNNLLGWITKLRKSLLTSFNCCEGYNSVQFSCSVVSCSLWPHGLQHARLPCPSPTPRACSNSCSLSQWCHPTISSSVIPFSSCLQSFPASGSFPMSLFFTSGSQSIRVSASVFPMNIQD